MLYIVFCLRNLRGMESRFLHTFLTVVDTGSMAAAARHFAVPASTVAQQITSLENDLGVELLERSGRTLVPTVAASRVIEYARELLLIERNLRSSASRTELPAGPLRLGVTPTTLMGQMPPILREWIARYPEIDIYLEPATSTILLEKVERNELDAAVAVHPRFKLAKTLQWSTLRREKFLLVVPSRLRSKNPLSILSSMPLIRYDRKTEGGRLADEYIRHQGIICKVQFELDGIEQIAKLVAEGLGVAVLPDWPIIGPVNPRLARLPLPEPCPERLVGLTWLGSSKRAALVAAFLKVAMQVSAKKIGRR